MTNIQAAEYDRDAIKMMVADNLSAELKRKRWTLRKASSALGLTVAYVTRRASGNADLSASDLVMFADFLDIPVSRFFLNDENAPAMTKGRAGASGISTIVNMDDVRKVGPTGLEPMTSTVEDGRFGAGWVAPVTMLRAVSA